MISLDEKVIQGKQLSKWHFFIYTKVNGYYSKKLLYAVWSYGFTEFELICLVCNIHSFNWLVKHHSFEVWLGHKSIDNVWNGKTNYKQTENVLLKLCY